jgi:hypothetical protein
LHALLAALFPHRRADQGLCSFARKGFGESDADLCSFARRVMPGIGGKDQRGLAGNAHAIRQQIRMRAD